MHRLCLVAVLSGVLGMGLATTPSAAAEAPAGAAVDSVPVSFEVANVNRSALQCSSDGARYVLQGRLIGPEALLSADADGRVATLYLHEFSFGKFFWNFAANPAYDYATQQAREGHVSVVIDRLGYDDSPHPPGRSVCVGSHADMARQIVSALKAGRYGVEGSPSPKFEKVVLAGHSVGAAAAELAAHSFPDIGIAGLIVFAWADQGFSDRTVDQSLQQSRVCATGGQEAEPGAPSGYAYYGQTAEDFQKNVFFSAEPDVVAAATAMRNRDPCGDAGSVTPATVVNSRNLGKISVPVLLLFGRNDTVFNSSAADRQKALFSGSEDVTLRMFDETAHAMTLERSAPRSRLTVSEWLLARDLITPGARPGSSPSPMGPVQLLAMSGRTVRLTRSGAIPVRLRCLAGDAACKGRLRLVTARRLTPRFRGKRARRLRLARRAFSLRGEEKRTLGVRLSQKTLRVVRRRRTVRVELQAVTRATGGHERPSMRTFVVKVPRR